MKRIVVRDSEAGNIIETVSTFEDGLELINKFEKQDKEDGNYTKDFYEVAEIEE